MSVDRTQEKIDDLFETFIWSDKESQVLLFEKINKEIESFFVEENNSSDLTDGVFDLLSRLSDSVQKEFEELLSDDSDKKKICRGTVKKLALLLNTKVNTAEKIK